jgi:hypothetical protein
MAVASLLSFIRHVANRDIDKFGHRESIHVSVAAASGADRHVTFHILAFWQPLAAPLPEHAPQYWLCKMSRRGDKKPVGFATHITAGGIAGGMEAVS